MKKILMPLGAMLLMIIISCTSSKEPVTGKSSDLKTDFKDINSYSWVSDIDKIPEDRLFVGPNGVWVFNNESARKMIKDAIQYELDSRGYSMNTNPDMLVSFSILEQPGQIRTTNGYLTLTSGEKVRTEDHVTYTDVKAGTVIVNFIDAKSNKVIWQGFASGILQPDQMKDESKVRHAVSQVFSEFKHKNI